VKHKKVEVIGDLNLIIIEGQLLLQTVTTFFLEMKGWQLRALFYMGYTFQNVQIQMLQKSYVH